MHLPTVCQPRYTYLLRPGTWIAVLAWAGCVVAGLVVMLRYEFTPGDRGRALARWPADSTIDRPAGTPVLVMFVHPHCPCTRASLAELARLIGQMSKPVAVRFEFVRPDGFSPGWERTALWDLAERIPGAVVTADPAGAEARRFGATTSGEALLYAADGRLLFHGGVTASRGHEGESTGGRALVQLVASSESTGVATPVYGCALGCQPGRENGVEEPCKP